MGVSARPLTRRSFLLAGAGALAAGCARPCASLAGALGLVPPRLSERWLGAVPAGGRAIALPVGADLLGVEWRAPAAARRSAARQRARRGPERAGPPHVPLRLGRP